jgi:hypothetical protein
MAIPFCAKSKKKFIELPLSNDMPKTRLSRENGHKIKQEVHLFAYVLKRYFSFTKFAKNLFY